MVTSPAGAEEEGIPAFAVIKGGVVLKNIFLNAPPPEMRSGGEEGEGEEPPVLIGRHPDCHVVVDHPSISRFHLEVRPRRRHRRLTVTDLSSVHGTWVSERRIPPNTPVELVAGDTLRLGASKREYRLHWLSLHEAFELEGPLPPLLEEDKEEFQMHQEASQQFVADAVKLLDIAIHQGTSQQVVEKSAHCDKEILSAPLLPEFTNSLSLEEPTLLKFHEDNEGVAKEEVIDENSEFSAIPPILESSGSSFLHDLGKNTPEPVPATMLSASAERAVQSDKVGSLSMLSQRRSKSKSVGFVRLQTDRRMESSILIHGSWKEGFQNENDVGSESCEKEGTISRVLFDNMDVKEAKESEQTIEPDGEIMTPNVSCNIITSLEGSNASISNELMDTISPLNFKDVIFSDNGNSMLSSAKEMGSTELTSENHIAQVSVDIKLQKNQKEFMPISPHNFRDDIFSHRENSVLDVVIDMELTKPISENHVMQDGTDGNMKSRKDMKYDGITPQDWDGSLFLDKENVTPASRKIKPNIGRVLGSRKGNLMSGEYSSNSRGQQREQQELSAKSTGFDTADKLFYSDKENLTPISSGMKVRRGLPKSLTKVADHDQDAFCSDKENMTPSSSAAQELRDMSKSPAQIESKITKKRVDRVPFQTLLANSPLIHSGVFDRDEINARAVHFATADLAIRLEDELNNLSDRIYEGKKVWTMVTDTDCLLDDDSRKSIMLLRGIKRTHLIVPRIVLRELDCMKRRKHLFRRSSKASSILQWIEECMEKENWWMHVQSSSEMLPVVSTPPATHTTQCNDEGECVAGTFNPMAFFCRSFTDVVSPTTEDHILDCTLQFKKVRRNEDIVILSNSITLKIKAMTEGLRCEEPKKFREALMNPCSNRFMWAGSMPRGPSWSCLDEVALAENYYNSHHAASRIPRAVQAVKGLKLILLHNSLYA